MTIADLKPGMKFKTNSETGNTFEVVNVTKKRVSYKNLTGMQSYKANKNIISVYWLSDKQVEKYLNNGWWITL